MREYLFVLVVAAAVTFVVTPLVRRWATRIGALTPVRERDVHVVPVPRLGGVAMLAGVAAAILTASQMPFLSRVFEGGRPGAAFVVLAAAAAVCLLGVADDLWGLDAITKLAGQVLAAGLLAWEGVRLLQLPLDGVTLLSSRVLLVLTVLAVVLTINAVNFTDGLDGLAAGIVAIGGAAFFVYSYRLAQETSPGDVSSLASLLIAATVGCCLGFLPHNFNPARIFMGDSGSMLLGLLLASSTIAITGQVDPMVVSQQQLVPAFLPILLPLAVLLVPLVDLLFAVVRRMRAGQAPWAPDKHHLHHQLLSLGHSHRRAVLLMYGWTAIVAFGATSLAYLSATTVAITTGAVVLVVLVLTFGPLRAGRQHSWGPGSSGPSRSPAPAADTAPSTVTTKETGP